MVATGIGSAGSRVGIAAAGSRIDGFKLELASNLGLIGGQII